LLREFEATRDFPPDERPDTGGWVSKGGNLMVRREWLDACARADGYAFNEAWATGEDVELVLRLRRFGITVVYVPAAVKHLRRLSPLGFLKRQFGRGVCIARLYRFQRSLAGTVARQQSRIWGAADSAGPLKWLLAIWYKLVGPFNIHAFAQARRFWLFWLGEKIQGAGFLWGMLRGVTASPREKSTNP